MQNSNEPKELQCVSGEQLEFCGKLRKAQGRIKEKLKGLSFGIIQRQITERKKKGLPLLDFSMVPLDRKLWLELLRATCELITDYRPKEEASLSKLIEAAGKSSFDYRGFLRDAVSFRTDSLKALSEEAGIDGLTLLFIGINTAKPFFESVSESLASEIEDNLWQKGSCPVCAGRPLMTKLRRQDGKRIFQCWICGSNWQFPRIKCPFCENEDEASLRFFFTDEKSPFRVDVCDKCKGYIKTLDERKISEGREPDLVIEDIVSGYLDIMAEEEGYNRVSAV